MRNKKGLMVAGALLGSSAALYYNYKKKQELEYSRLSEIKESTASDMITPGCLVLEGGSLRGLYTAGVLDCLIDNDLNFQTTIGISAGAMMGANYHAGHRGRAGRFNLEYRNNIHYVGLGAEIENQSPFNFDFAFDDKNFNHPFDKDRLYSEKRNFYAGATDVETGEAVYFNARECDDIFSAIRASASLPVASKIVEVDGHKCLDGGCADPIPVKWAIDKGFDKIIVVRTRERTFRKDVDDQRESIVVEQRYKKYPEYVEKMKKQHSHYNEQCDLVDKLENEGRVFVLAPQEPVNVGRLEGDLEKLGDLYFEGYDETNALIGKLKEYLAI
ncbi:patatin family protein [Butyrivibrio sp. INlla16]|uniref:patatin-like phospholipase family protein n=1 Tax=Butyrivibrio sp. INlla16 TaxID=1520807 RepID=UPI00087DF8F8|nr:patatin family protein [Butyrivibrio sp. INlla16]SDB50174.1 Predicted phospholipase, patatin/cPLA2 family [Butyrivibrio sp. INlla16]